MKSDKLHYPIPDSLYPEKYHGSLFRPVLCRGSSEFLCLDVEHMKQKREPTDMYMFHFKETPGFDYGESSQSYYTRDITDVTCPGCLKVIERYNRKDLGKLKELQSKHLKRMVDANSTRLALKRHIHRCLEKITELKASIYDAKDGLVKIDKTYDFNKEKSRRLQWSIEVKKSLSSNQSSR